MSTYDPRVVGQALEDLQNEIARWSSAASDMLSTAEGSQRSAKEGIERALHNANIVLDRAKDDEENLKKAISSVNEVLEKCLTAITSSLDTQTQSETILAEAKTTLHIWQAELEKALAWLIRAEARLEEAIQEHARAVSALRSAEWSLSNAESRYRSCMNDKERNNCNSEIAAVNRARAEVVSAQAWVRDAKQEVDAAKDEVTRAKARVGCCKQSVAFSSEAVAKGEESVSSAAQAVTSAERSHEHAKAAEILIRTAEKKVNAEIDAAETTMVETRLAQNLTFDAARKLDTADKSEGSAQIYSTLVQKEIAHRIQRLYELNRPTS